MELAKDTILIIEDNAGLNELLCEKVHDCGYQTYSVYSAVQAFEWLEVNNAFLILLDFSLPDLNGREFIEWLHSENIPLPPFIVATGQGDERIAVQMMKLGARDYVVKDSDFLELIPLLINKVCNEIENEQKLKITEIELAESNKFNKQIIKSAQEGIVVYDLELKYLVWNPFMERLTGVQSKDVLGKYVFDVFPFLEKTQMSEKLEQALKGDQNSEIEFYFSIPETGKSGWVSETYAPLRNAENHLIGAIVAIHDITDRKIVEKFLVESEEKYRVLVENVGIGLALYSIDGKILFFNDQAVRNMGGKLEDYIGKSLYEFFDEAAANEYVNRIQLTINSEKSIEFEDYVTLKGGSYWFLSNHSKLLDKDGQLIGVQVLAHDMTERKLAEKEIEKIGQHYKALIEKAPDGIVLLNEEGQFKYVSPAAMRMFGYDANRVVEGNPADYTHPDDLEMVMTNLKRIIEDPTFITTLQYRFGDKNGNWKWVETTFSNLLADTNVESIVLNFRDITERKLAELELLESESRYHALFNSSFEAIFLTSPDGTILAANTSACEMFMMSEEELKLRGRNGIVDSTDPRLPMALEVREKTGIYNGELNYIRSNGEIFTGEISSSFFIDKDGNRRTSTIIRDITERKITEQALCHSEALYRNLVDRLPDGVYKSTPEGKFVAVNPALVKMLGYDNKEEMMAIDIKTDLYFDVADRESLVRNEFNQELDAFILKKKDGSAIWVEDNGWYTKDENGNIITHEGVLRDITDRKKAEEALFESEAKYRELVENSPDAIAIYVDGKIIFVNNACLGLMGANSKDELMGRSVFEFVHPHSRSVVVERMKIIQTSGMVLDSQEEMFLRLDGTPVDVEVKAMSLIMDKKLAVQLIVRDITERKKAEFVIQENRNMLHELLFTSTELIESTSNTIDFDKITEIARNLSGAKFACFNMFDENGRDFQTVAFAGMIDFKQKALEVSGFEIINKKWVYDPVREACLKDNTITEFESLEALAHNLLPKFVYNKIKQTYKIGKVAVVKITKNNRNIGDLTLLLNEGAGIKNPEILELYANQVGLFIERQLSEEKLRKNEEKFRILFAENPQPMYVYDLETLEILEVNQTALSFYGYTKEECMCMTVKDLHPLEEMPVFLKKIEDTKAGIITDGISHHIKRNGEKITVEIFTVPATSLGANARQVLVVDITERKLAEEALTQRMDELMRFQHLTVGREHSMIELKREINHLLVKNGEMEKYKIVE